MIADRSALVAIVFQEPEFEALTDKLLTANGARIRTPTLVETGVVLAARLKHDARALLLRILEEFEIVEVPFGEAHWREALSADRRFGRGRHRANPNFGECLSYAVAQIAGEPLPFVGNDFAATDVVPA